MVRARVFFVTIALWGPVALSCSFDVSGVSDTSSIDSGFPDGGGPDGSLVDAIPADAAPPCEIGETRCDGNTLQTCLPDQTGFEDAPCEFVCGTVGDTAQCLFASNVPSSIYAMCAGNEQTFSPPAGATVTVTEPSSNTPRLACDPHCGVVGQSEIIAVTHDENVTAWFCLANVNIPADVRVVHDGTSEEAMIWLVDGTVQIDGAIDISGDSAVEERAGDGGPGGGDGGARSTSAGEAGDGACAGAGGERASFAGFRAGGGGGGGGFGGQGGKGGQGNNFSNTAQAAGGDGGAVCGIDELVPVSGGSGGGSGTQASNFGCGAGCGGGGGGGGGGVQIAARISITHTGEIDVSGGDGYGADHIHGGGGGGAGGGVLLESPIVTIDTGTTNVEGGNGGEGGAGGGGAGASKTDNGGDGADQSGISQGGAGGGGGRGRVRINALEGTAMCAFVSPQSACTTGALNTNIAQ